MILKNYCSKIGTISNFRCYEMGKSALKEGTIFQKPTLKNYCKELYLLGKSSIKQINKVDY